MGTSATKRECDGPFGLLLISMGHNKIEVTAGLVQDLLRDQHPDLADQPVRLGALGWDNQLWRLGENLAVRLPWATDSADELIRKEYTWVPTLAATLPLPVPVPQRFGEPSQRFPHPWIVTTWVPGTPADQAPVTDATEAAVTLATFLTDLHRPASEHAPRGRDRGGPLADYSSGFARLLTQATEFGLIPDPVAVRAVWERALRAPTWDGPPLWLHADLHPANVLTAQGTICGVIDFGDLCAGDPACDLAAGWILLPDGHFGRFIDNYRPSCSADTFHRTRGYAVLRALAGILIGDAGVHGRPGGKPTWGPPGHAALRRLIATIDD